MNNEELYKENILDHASSPRNFGALSNATFSHKELNTNCGDEFTFHFSIDNEKRVTEVRFEGIGCAVSKAAASMLTEALPGKTLKEILAITTEDILAMLGIPMTTSRLRCALLGLKAVHIAIENEMQNDDK